MNKLIILATFLLGMNHIYATSVTAKAQETRVDLLNYLRQLEPMVKNYPGKDLKDNKDVNPLDIVTAKDDTAPRGDRIIKYDAIKRLYLEGVMYYYEGRYINSYRRFLEAQINTEQLMEELSQYYIEGTDEILKSAMEMRSETDQNMKGKDGKPAQNDRDVVDISVESGRGSAIFPIHRTPRQAGEHVRDYNPKDYHYVLNKDAIEGSASMGYKLLSQAKTEKLEALKIEKNLEKHQKLNPEHRKQRIEMYFNVIARCRESRMAAMNIFRLKYPNDNYYLQEKNDEASDVIKDEKNVNVKNHYRLNPFVYPAHINPIFDNRIPVGFRRDASDMHNKIFAHEVNGKIKMKYADVDYINRSIEKLEGERVKRGLASVPDANRLDKPKDEPAPAAPKENTNKSGTDKQPTPPTK